jgi:hypothetical protein
MKPELTKTIWLAADYHFATIYSCRYAMSGIGSTRAIPTPGPGTIRLALIRTAIELFGMERVRAQLFPMICSMTIVVRPPERVAIATQRIRAYKALIDSQQTDVHFDESITQREFAHATGPMTIYLHLPIQCSDVFRAVLMATGYWGQASSLAQCTAVEVSTPQYTECAVPLHSVSPQAPIRDLVTGFVTEFRDSRVRWEEVIDERGVGDTDVVRPELYVWPLHVIEQRGSKRMLLRCSIPSITELRQMQ